MRECSLRAHAARRSIPQEAPLVWSRHVQLRVGVIGLGRLWEARHKPALARLRDRFLVTAVYDQVLRRAEIEAGHLGCAAVEGLSALVNRPDVDVVHVLTPQWFGLHPIDLACDAGKPVYCALPLAGAVDELEALAAKVEASGVAFMPEFARRFYPATLRLRELLATTLGRPRLILGHSRLYGFDRYGSPGPTTQNSPAPLMIDPGQLPARLVLLPLPVRARRAPRAAKGRSSPGPRTRARRAAPGPDFESFTAEFAGGGLAQISFGRYHRDAWGDATRFLPRPGSRSTPSAGPPGSSCPTASSGPTRRARTRSGFRWSRPSATSSTTSSTGSSAATSRSPRRSATPWPSPAASPTSAAASARGGRVADRGAADDR